ncbi:MAG: hypothetical protein PHG81_09945 [Aliarcobacter sp.]|nr:hypothetical protein [Aliarcobacter sp.]
MSYFRIIGILVLISISGWFAIELHRYIATKYTFAINKFDKFLFIVPIMLGSLSYYTLWLITPSYNWLSLLSVILVILSLIRVINNKELNYERYVTLDYILLSFSLSLAFMAKPTTALSLVFISVLFVWYEWKNINIKKALLSVVILTIIIVIAHIFLLDGGFSSYYYRLSEGMERLALLGGGHDLGSRFNEMTKLTRQFFLREFYFYKINNFYIYGSLLIVLVLHIFKNKINSLNLYFIFMSIILVTYSYSMLNYGLIQDFRFMWIRVIELLLLNFILIIISLLFMDNKMSLLKEITKVIGLLFLMILGSFACKFGTNNNIIFAMSDSSIFIVSSIIVLNFTFDRLLNIRIFTTLSGLILSVFIYFLINNAYKHPYRLITDIKEQNQTVELLGTLKVDKTTKVYVEDLQKISSANKSIDEKISLIDMTGGSPGANIILEADFFGTQWLIGGYPGSNDYVLKILKTYQGSEKLHKAWILTAPNGSRKIDLNILNQLGLNFPDKYKKIGTVKTADRDEIQELWKPTD